MKNLFIFGLMLFTICTAQSQDAVRKQEFQVSLDVMDGIKNANFYYKVSFKNNSDKHFRSRIGRFKDYYTDEQRSLFLDANKYSIGIGYEFRMPLIRKSKLILGIEPFGNYQKYNDYNYKLKPVKAGSSLWEAGIGIPLGIIFNSSSEWYVGVETIPSFFYQEINKDEFEILEEGHNSLNFGFYNMALCFGYRIPTKRI